jgi:hypothetical protein
MAATPAIPLGLVPIEASPTPNPKAAGLLRRPRPLPGPDTNHRIPSSILQLPLEHRQQFKVEDKG